MESSYEMELCVGKKFKSKYECFTFFKHLMSKENFKLINNLTNDIPLNKINNILNKYNYVWINIIDKFEKQKLRYNDKYLIIKENYDTQVDILKNCCEKVSFLFVKKNKTFQFLGIYQLVKIIKNEKFLYTYAFKKIEKNTILLNDYEIRNIIEENSRKLVMEPIKDEKRIKQLLEADIDLFQYLPKILKNDKKFLLETSNRPYGENIKYAELDIRNDKEFAKKFLEENGYSLQYFSEEIRNDIEICRIACNLGYNYATDNIRKNKQLALEVFVPFHMKIINKNLRKDKDIIKKFWDEITSIIGMGGFEWLIPCSIIGIDDFGNEIIDKFLKKEKEKHTTARILQYEEQTELIQLVKTIKTTYNDIFNIYDFDKQLFNIEESTKLIVLIGKEENIVSKNLKKEYSFHKENERYNTNIIEIYTQDYNDTINL